MKYSSTKKETNWLVEDGSLGLYRLEEMHQRLGSLVLVANILRLRELKKLGGKYSKFIQGSTRKKKYGLWVLIMFSRTNFMGVLDKPLGLKKCTL